MLGHVALSIDLRLLAADFDDWNHNEMLADFQVLFCYDLGNGLTVQRGSERLAEWVPAVMQSLPRDPLAAIRFVSGFGRYLGNRQRLRAREPHDSRPGVGIQRSLH